MYLGFLISCKAYIIANAYSTAYTKVIVKKSASLLSPILEDSIIYTAYIQRKSNYFPKVEVAWINNHSYQAIVSKITDGNVVVGISQKSGDTIVLRVSSKQCLYKVELKPISFTGVNKLRRSEDAHGRIVLQFPRNPDNTALILTRPI